MEDTSKTQNQDPGNLQESQETQVPKAPDAEAVRRALGDGEDFDIPPIKPKEDKPVEKTKGDEPETKEEPVTKTDDDQEDSAAKADDDQGKEPVKKPETDTGQKLSPVWGRLKKDYEEQFGEGTFKFTEDVTPDNEYDKLVEFFQNNLEPSLEELPQEAKEIIELHKQGKYDPEKYFSQRKLLSEDFTKLPDKELMHQVYRLKYGKSEQQPDGVTDEEITEELSKKTRLQLKQEAEAVRGQIEQNRLKVKQEADSKRQKLIDQNYEKIIEKQKNDAQKIVNQLKDDRDFFGIEMSEEEKSSFDQQGFYDMIKLNKETGKSKLIELMSDDKIAYKIAGILAKGNLSSYITDAKEKTKQRIEDTLDPTLEKEKGSTKMAKAVDRQNLI